MHPFSRRNATRTTVCQRQGMIITCVLYIVPRAQAHSMDYTSSLSSRKGICWKPTVHPECTKNTSCTFTVCYFHNFSFCGVLLRIMGLMRGCQPFTRIQHDRDPRPFKHYFVLFFLSLASLTLAHLCPFNPQPASH